MNPEPPDVRALESVREALQIWLHQYEPGHCDAADVAHFNQRRAEIGGTVAVIAEAFAMLESESAGAAALREALAAYEDFWLTLFASCASNGVFNAWGKSVECTKANEAHRLGETALATPAGQPVLDELRDRRAWKASQLSVESSWNCQKVGQLLDVSVGADIRANIEPKVRALLNELRSSESIRRAEKEILIKEIEDHTKTKAELAALREHLAVYQREFPSCEKHIPNGGARSGCLICALEKLSAALSQIDYLCGEPNDMQVSGYDVHCNEDTVVEQVKWLKEQLAVVREAATQVLFFRDGEQPVRGWLIDCNGSRTALTNLAAIAAQEGGK